MSPPQLNFIIIVVEDMVGYERAAGAGEGS
jgi:hypothetical protein